MADREDGWYRVTGHEWEPVPDDIAEAEIADGGGWDLVQVHSVLADMDPLF